jgi:hypothetical protein
MAKTKMVEMVNSLPAERIPKGNKQTSGKTKYNRMGNKSLKGDSLGGLPKTH